jgi:hypothetical protein
MWLEMPIYAGLTPVQAKYGDPTIQELRHFALISNLDIAAGTSRASRTAVLTRRTAARR